MARLLVDGSGTGGTGLAYYSSSSRSAQYFVMPSGYTRIAYVNIYIRKVGTPGTLYAAIRNDSGGNPGTTIVEGSRSEGSISTSYSWNVVDFPDAAVSAGSGYWLVTRQPSSTGLSDAYFWGTAGSGSGGKYTTNSESTWNNISQGQWSYQIYGYGPPASMGATSTSNVGETSFTATSSVGDDMGEGITNRGFCYSSSTSNPTIADSTKQVGSGTGSFSTSITGLAAGVTYYIRSYATNAAGTSYGAVTTQTTATAAPTVTTGAVTNITTTTATVAGNVTDDHGAAVSTRGICYAVTPNPTTANDKVASGSGEGPFSSNLTGLSPNTLYYARAYATNSVGTSYGSQTSFTTLQGTPEVITGLASSVTKNSATCAGEVVDDNGSAVTEAGIVYSINANPTIANNKVTTSSGVGVFSENLTGLAVATEYHYRAYAINAEGVSYGEDKTFTTTPAGPTALTVTVTGKTTADVSWVKGSGADTTLVRRRPGSYPVSITDGNSIYSGAGNSTTDTGLDPGTTYYYKAWSLDGVSNYSTETDTATATTDYSLTDPMNTTAADGVFSTGPANDNKLYVMLSKDGGITWSDPREIELSGVNTEYTMGDGSTELWGTSWNGDDVDDTNFRLMVVCGSDFGTYQIFKDFGFSISPTQTLTGIKVIVKGYFDSATTYIDFIGVSCLYGTSVLPITEGAQAYDSTTQKLVLFNGSGWVNLGATGPTGPTGATGPTGTIEDVVDLRVSQPSIGNAATIEATGADANIDLNISAKGNGWVNIGSTLQIPILQITKNSADNNGPAAIFNKVGSTAGASTAIKNHAQMGSLQAWGYDGSAWSQGGFVGIWADQDWSGSGHGSMWSFQHVENDTTSSYRIALQSDSQGVQINADSTGGNFLKLRKNDYNRLHFVSAANDSDASTLLAGTSNNILIGVSGDKIIFYWSDGSGNKYKASVTGTTLT